MKYQYSTMYLEKLYKSGEQRNVERQNFFSIDR